MAARERLCALADLAPGSARRFDVGDRRLAVVRIDDDVYVVGDRCTHQDISLAEGDVLVEERQIECWKHGSAFSLETGAPSSLPATKPTPVYEVDVVDGDVHVVLP
ncbi:MAG TPA: non-heme iron oxygenase ferredoxin subunit [Acidimicrobiales bacterium]|nr:non-heme iron oxygenase ferredoxin subunit [Acidimicrobiales bacterium]